MIDDKHELEQDTRAVESVPTFLPGRRWFEANVDSDFLDFTEPYKPPRYTLERKGIPFANIGELHVISGKAGHGKTNLMSMLMAAILSGWQGNTLYRENIPEPVVLYVDTEMGKDDTIAVKNRVCTLAGMPYDKPSDQFAILRLRDTESAIDRWRKTLKALWTVKERLKENQCLHLFLDGMLDIVEDYNDQKECQPIIRECMMTATEFDTSMWIVQHENPMVDKLVGTLGSILQRKVSEIFTVRKIIQSKLKPSEKRADRPEIYFTVDQLKARGRDIESFDFEVTTESGWGMPKELTNVSPAMVFTTNHTTDELKAWITDRQYNLEWPTTRSKFCQEILVPNGILDNSEQSELIAMSLNRGFIVEQQKEEMAKGQRNPRLKLNNNLILPFGDKIDEPAF